MIGVSEAWYSRFESGRATMSLKLLNRLSAALRLEAAERAALLRLALPEYDLFASHLTAQATRELRAFRRFQRRAEAASSPDDLIAMATEAVSAAIPHVAISSVMTKSDSGVWLHRSPLFPEVAAAMNEAGPIDERVLNSSRIVYDGLSIVGCADYRATAEVSLLDRNARTALRSGYGVRIPLSDGYVGYCLKERSEPNVSHVLFLNGVANTIALTMRGSGMALEHGA